MPYYGTLDQALAADNLTIAYLARPARRKLPAAVAGIATVTYGANGATTLTGSTLTSYTSSVFAITGADLQPYAGNAAYGLAKPIGNASQAGGLSVSFGFIGQAFEFNTYVAAGMYRVWVNGEVVQDWAAPTGTLNSDRLIKVDMGARDVYDVRLDLDRLAFGGVRIVPTDLLVPCQLRHKLRVVVVGDSFGNGQSFSGSNAGTGAPNFTPGYHYWLRDLLGVDDLWPRAIGGTGFKGTNNGTQPTFRGRLAADVVPYAPDVVIFQGTINDNPDLGGWSAAQLAAEIDATYLAVRAALPGALILATTQLLAADGSGASDTAHAANISAAWAARGVPVLDLHAANTGNGQAGYRTVAGAAISGGTLLTVTGTADDGKTGFGVADIGRLVNGPGIPAGTKMLSPQTATTITLSNVSTNATGLTVNVTAATGNGSADFNRCADGTHPQWPAGYRHLAQRMAAGIAPLLAASS